MKRIILLTGCLCYFYLAFGQNSSEAGWKSLVKPSHVHLNAIIADQEREHAPLDSIMCTIIKLADQSFSISELSLVVNICSKYYYTSEVISELLTQWLKENHPIYINKPPSETNQFRGYVLSSLSKFPPNEELYNYVKAEFLFAAHPFNIAAAAATAVIFTDKATELVQLMEPFLSTTFRDQWVDITTPLLNYPIIHPTKARYEIIRTLFAFGAPAFQSVQYLDEIVKCKYCGTYDSDTSLYLQAIKTADYLRKVTPECCQKDAFVNPIQNPIALIGKPYRKELSTSQVNLIDQEGQPLKFGDLKDKPFVLTFFYTQCTNSLKCVSTVHRLGELESECIKNKLENKVGIYGMTYDPYFDSPSILKKYGQMYGVKFNENTKFLKTADSNEMSFNTELKLRVNYGAGTVNQHGIQLFVFDKKGRLAAVCDNDLWEVNNVYKILTELIQE